MLYDAASDSAVFSTTYHVRIVDRVGGGDSFGGGLIYALVSGKERPAGNRFCRCGFLPQARRGARLQPDERRRSRGARRGQRFR